MCKQLFMFQSFVSIKYDVPLAVSLFAFRARMSVKAKERRYDDEARRCEDENVKLRYCYRSFAYELLLLHLRTLLYALNMYLALYISF